MVLTESALRERLDRSALVSTPGGYTTWDFYAMGTDCRILFRARSRGAAAELRTQWLNWLARFEFRCSRFIPDSIISTINANAGGDWTPCDEELDGLFALCDRYHWLTHGVLDPTSLPLIRLWDYKAETPRLPDPAAIEEARQRVGWTQVERRPGAIRLPHPGMAIDLGGIGKEYAVDRVVEMAQKAGVADIMVSFGADVRVSGSPPEGGPWRVGLESPSDPGSCWTGLTTHERAVASSGDYLRYMTLEGRRYGHIIDARSGYPVSNDSRSCSVIAPTCTEAGVLSTAAFILGREAGLALIDSVHQAEGCIWTEHGAYPSRRFNVYVIQQAS